MLKVISVVIITILLLSCLPIMESNIKTMPTSDAVAIEERTVDNTQANVIVTDNASFESKGLQTQGVFDSNKNTKVEFEQKAVAEFKNTNTSFVLYFSYDAAEIDGDLTREIIKHANFMSNNPNLKLRLEGHADERGTREYNLALGENRALSVKEILDLYGLSSRIEVVSFGEEKPIAREQNESAWHKNRRVEFIYK